MNCPSRTDEPEGTGFNQNPSSLSADLTTRQDLNGIANARVLRRIASGDIENVVEQVPDDETKRKKETSTMAKVDLTSQTNAIPVGERGMSSFEVVDLREDDDDRGDGAGRGGRWGKGLHFSPTWMKDFGENVVKFGKFVGPGFLVHQFLEFIVSSASSKLFVFLTALLRSL